MTAMRILQIRNKEVILYRSEAEGIQTKNDPGLPHSYSGGSVNLRDFESFEIILLTCPSDIEITEMQGKLHLKKP